MKQCRKCLEQKPLTAFYFRKDNDSYRTECKLCLKADHGENYRKNKDKRNEASRAYYLANNAKLRALATAWSQANPDKMREYKRKWKVTHRAYRVHDWTMRYAAKLKATPKWITAAQRKEIRGIYKACPKGFHVDHIVPLRGKTVRGLHVPWNLQYLPAVENIVKGNRL